MNVFILIIWINGVLDMFLVVMMESLSNIELSYKEIICFIE